MASLNQANTLNFLNFATGAISLAACLWLFHFYAKTHKPRPASLKLIFALTMSDFFYSIANIMSAITSDTELLCQVEAIMRETSVLSTLYWACCIAILTYKSFTEGKCFKQDAFFVKALVIGLVLPLLYAAIPAFSPQYAYGKSAFGCWIQIEIHTENYVPSAWDKFILLMLFDGVPVILALFITLLLYGKVAKRVHEISSQLSISTDIEVRKLFWYPAVLFLAYIPSLIDNIVEEIFLIKASFGFTVLHIVLTHTVGLTNALVYGLQRKKYYDMYEKPQKIQNDIEEAKTAVDYDNHYAINDAGDSDDEENPKRHRSSCYHHLLSASSVEPY